MATSIEKKELRVGLLKAGSAVVAVFLAGMYAQQFLATQKEIYQTVTETRDSTLKWHSNGLSHRAMIDTKVAVLYFKVDSIVNASKKSAGVGFFIEKRVNGRVTFERYPFTTK